MNRAILIIALLFALTAVPVLGQSTDASSVQINFSQGQSYSVPIQILVILTLLSFLPAMLISVTCFTRIIVVAHFLRQAIGTQSAPSNQILIGLALFLTLFVMGPTWDRVYEQAIQPYQEGKIGPPEAFEKAAPALREFMLRQVREKDLALFVRISGMAAPATVEDIPLRVVIPAFMISELKTAFQIGFVLFLPFLVIDMVISSILLSSGMMMLPPVVISTPFKILLFILVDGWNLVIGSLVQSFR
jgi:flagellar biosynthesis protein FliP